ncbi:MAG: SEC-C metal-binding domain-containing protein [Candidatus Methylumidiphilus sp.]
MIFTRHELSNQITATLPNEGIGQYYDCSITVCRNPLCQCNEIFVSLTPHLLEDGKQNDSRGAWMLDVNIIERSLVEREYSSAELSFARKVHEWLHEEDYQLLWGEYYAHKLKYTETADLSTLQAEFPVEDIEYNSVMVSYADVLPYARKIIITINDNRYLVEDLYCVKNKCPCTRSVLCFYRLDKAISPDSPVLDVYVDHKTKQWKVAKGNPANDRILDDKTAKQQLEAEHSNIYGLLAQRHRQLKSLYANSLKSHVQRQIPSEKNVGRNDPCPCGSGKKYKKCCGTKRLL